MEKPNNCDMSDIVCQMQVLAHLRGIQSVLGEERFKVELPELSTLPGTLTEKIADRERTLEDTMRSCGMLSEEEPLTTLNLEPATTPEVEPEPEE